MTVAIWWIRRDLRLSDNPALTAAVETAKKVIPLFIVDLKLIESRNTGIKRLSFLYNNLSDLDSRLRSRGSRLILRAGNPVDVLKNIIAETGSAAIYAEPDYTPYAQARDRRASEMLPIQWTGSPLVHPPGSLLTNQKKPYTVYTPFGQTWKSLPFPSRASIAPIPESIPATPNLESLPIPEPPVIEVESGFPAGEEVAHQKLSEFVTRGSGAIYQYQELRNRPDLDATSHLSPYLRFGLLSGRQAALAAMDAIQTAQDAHARSNAEIWLNELIWREFYAHFLYFYPETAKQNFRFPELEWQYDPESYTAWCEGRTGYPIVDAAQRQLVASGWMHNRLRMIVASFLTKDLLIDWRLGARFFMEHLIDGDPASNTGGWQWTAGTGADAAPYFRIFNPISQSKKYDPMGVYIRRWLPELAQIPEEYIHEPWKMPEQIQIEANCRIGKDYPAPIVDHEFARQRVLQAFRKVK